MSRCLAERSIDHVLLERGEVAHSWRTERWDSLRLLTPNWQSRLPGFGYEGADPDGYRNMAETVAFLERYASVIAAPVESHTRVTSVCANGSGFLVSTDRGDWHSRTVVPSLHLTGSDDRLTLDLNLLTSLGVRLVGRLAGISDGKAQFSGSLRNKCALSDLKMNRLLNTFDEWATANGLDGEHEPPHRLPPTEVETSPALILDLEAAGIRSVIWATGFLPDYSWLEVPVLDRKGLIRHDGGVVAQPGLYLMGMQFLRRRKSALIDGAGDDGRDLIVPGLRSSNLHIVDCATDPRKPRLHKVIEGAEIKAKTNLSAPHTIHCLGSDIIISMLGNARGEAPGGFLQLNENFEIVGRWENDSTGMLFNYDFWYQPRHNVMVSSEWA